MIKRSETGNGRRKFLSCSLELVARSYTCEADHWASRIKVQAARLIHRSGIVTSCPCGGSRSLMKNPLVNGMPLKHQSAAADKECGLRINFLF